MKLIVYASGVREAAFLGEESGVAHYNIAAVQAEVFSIIAERENGDEPGIIRAIFANPNSDEPPHTERVYPFCLDGDHAQTSADTGTITFQKADGSFAVPDFIALDEGQHRYDVTIHDASGGVHTLKAQINVGVAHWVSPPEPPIKRGTTRLIVVPVTRDERVTGVPMDRLDEFDAAIDTLCDDFIVVAPDEEEAGADGA